MKLASALLAAVLLVGCHEHGGHSHGHASTNLSLNNGSKWQTDEVVRSGMAAIRDRVQTAVKSIHAGSYSAGDYASLAAGIDSDVGTIMSKCKLAPEVDAQFHLVLSQVAAGTAAMTKDGDHHAGVVNVIHGLESYAAFFEHPGFQAVAH